MLRRLPIRNLEEVQAVLREIPRGGMKVAIIAMVEYFIGDVGAPGAGRHGLKHDDPYRQTTRKAVYGRTFESDAQRKYVMAAIKDGRIKIGQRFPDPTKASQAYGYDITKGGYGATIKNESPGAYWSREWGGWKNWRSVPKVIKDNMKGASRHATTEVNKYMKTKVKK